MQVTEEERMRNLKEAETRLKETREKTFDVQPEVKPKPVPSHPEHRVPPSHTQVEYGPLLENLRSSKVIEAPAGLAYQLEMAASRRLMY